jgi:outer membrane receptor for ferrienterochelin and colicin
MRLTKAGSWLAVALLLNASLASAQSTTGTISGRVVDAQQLPVPGVTVNAESPNLQGIRTAVTSENGDYIISLLPPGVYTITFELSGFQRVDRTVTLAPTQVLPVEVVMGPAAVSETVEVIGRSADVLTQTAQVALNISQDLIQTLPTNRDINAALLLAPAIHPTGPNGNYSISGSVSFENLFMVNGVTVNENLRGQANDLYIEDAIQETTVATAGVSAEFGRFTGGVVNVVTKSGGNLFSGSFREGLLDDDWRELTKYEKDAMEADPLHRDPRLNTTTNKRPAIVPTHEYTLGGPIMRDRLWFFTAGRLQKQKEGRQLVATNVPYEYTRDTARYEFKGTYSATSSHRFQSAYTKIIDKQLNNTFSTAASMDTNSLEDRELPQELFTVNYSGILTSSFFVEGRYSQRKFTFVGSGAKSTDLIDGTLMIDNARGLRYWSATFCGVCTPEKRDNENFFVKGSYFLSTAGAGSHTLVMGYDNFNDVRNANNHQSGSDYRILGTGTIVQGTTVYPVLLGSNDTTRIQFNPIPFDSIGSNFRTHALFISDSWRVSSRMTANLGIRWDKNSGKDQQGNLTAKDSAISPRLGVVWDPAGDQRWSITGSFGKYVTAISNSIADAASAAGNPQTYLWYYRGPDINANASGPLTSTPDAIRQVFNWFNSAGGFNLRPFSSAPTIPGVATLIGDSLTSPNVFEYAAGVNRQIGSRAAIRADYVYRDYRDFYTSQTDASTGRVTNNLGQQFDLTLIVNSNEPERKYQALNTQATYRFGPRTDVGGTYTLSHAWGNFEGENVGSGPVSSAILQYPEFKQEAWNYPSGDLQIDQRHRARIWVNYGLPWLSGLTLSAMQTLESGTPMNSANLNNTSANGINPIPFVTGAPAYVTPPPGSQTTYFYQVNCGQVPSRITLDCVGDDRVAFRLEGQKRTDFAANYAFAFGGTRKIDAFFQLQVVNLFGNEQFCGCGGTVFQNGGGVAQTRIDQTVRTSVSHPALYTAFNPFTTTPVQGVNFDLAPTYGTALNRFAYTTPRQLRIGFGMRF